MRKRRKKFDLPREFNIPSSLSAQEVDDAITHYNVLRRKNNITTDSVPLWDSAVTFVIALDLVTGSPRG